MIEFIVILGFALFITVKYVTLITRKIDRIEKEFIEDEKSHPKTGPFL